MASFCIPRASGLPGLPGPPDWISSTTPWNPQDEHHWFAAHRHDFGVLGAPPPDPTFLALFDDVGGQRFLYLSWAVQSDPTLGDAEGDSLFVGFQPSAAGADAILLKI